MLLLTVLMALAGPAACFRLVVLHTNDMHARLEEVAGTGGPCHGKNATCYGGFPRVASEAARQRAKEPDNTIFLNAGDNYQGSTYYYMFKWRVIKEFIDRVGIDVMSLGNHEFDDGVEGLEPYLESVKTPIVAANLDLSRVPYLTDKKYNLKPAVNLFVQGVNISVIGYVTPETSYLARPGAVGFKEEVPVLQKLAKEAKAGGAKIVIALGHSGFTMDKNIAREVEDVDVVVGGHTNTFLYTGTPPSLEVPESTYPHWETQPSGKRVPVVQAFWFTKYLGRLELEFDENFKLTSAVGNPILLNASIPQDEALLRDILTWKSNMSAQLDEVVGRQVVDLSGDCRNKECNMGSFLTDAIVDYHVRETEGHLYSYGWTNGPIAIMNSGAIRASLNLNETAGSLSEGDILTAVPFDNNMVRVVMPGRTVVEMLEQSVRGYNIKLDRAKGGFLQLSGLKVTYDLRKPEGQRVTEVLARCGACLVPKYELLDHSANYAVIMSQYIYEGGDGYGMFANISVADEDKLTWREVEAFRSYATKMTPIYAGQDGRITLIKADKVLQSSASTLISSNFNIFITLASFISVRLVSVMISP